MAQVKTQFYVKGMTCAACARNVENILKFTDGVKQAEVNYAMHQVGVEYDDAIPFSELKKQVQSIGYDLEEKIDYTKIKQDNAALQHKTKQKFWVAAAFSVPVFMLAMVFTNVTYSQYIMLVLSLPVLFYSGSHFYVSAVKKARHAQFNMDTLIALGTGSAFFYSVLQTFWADYFIAHGVPNHVYYESAVVIITLILLGNYIEENAKSATSTAIEKLMDLQAKTVLRLMDGVAEEIPIEAVMHGDILRVLPGAKFPVDGIVKTGTSYVDESMISGEPDLIEKSVGDAVTSGTVNDRNVLEIETTKVGAETVLASIIKMVQEAQSSKAPAQKLADKISSIFVPVVIFIALAAGAVWYFIGPEPAFTNAFVSCITVLIIACPCALGLATPTAITVGIGKAAQKGILVKDAQTLEQIKDVDVLLVDKTGTLTEGKPKVVEAVFSDKISDDLKAALRQAEEQSEHPIAEKIASYLKTDALASVAIENLENHAGNGMSFLYMNQRYFVGKPNWKKVNSSTWRDEHLKALSYNGCTIAEFSDGNETLGLFGLRDQLKPHAADAIKALQNTGVKVFMCTGDNEFTAKEISEEVGLDGFFANLLPADKAQKVEELTAQGNIVAMAGDGINDAPALAKAHVGIAMSTGTDVAIESAGLTLLKGDISKIEQAIHLSKRIVKTIQQNLFWAFFYNVLAIPVAAGVLYPVSGFLLNPMIAGAAMAFSSVTVVLNSLRLKRL